MTQRSPLELEEEAGTVLPARRAGFLCVISLLSTFLRCFVISSPRLSSAKTAETPPAAGAEAAAGGGGPGGGGGGGGGGAPAAEATVDAWYCETATP